MAIYSETGSLSLVLASLKLMVLLSQPPKGWFTGRRQQAQLFTVVSETRS